MCIDMCTDMCSEMCTKAMCMDMCADVCGDVCMRHVYGPASVISYVSLIVMVQLSTRRVM